jgi:hypothetical protein
LLPAGPVELNANLAPGPPPALQLHEVQPWGKLGLVTTSPKRQAPCSTGKTTATASCG